MTAAGRRVGSPTVELPLPAVTLSEAAAASEQRCGVTTGVSSPTPRTTLGRWRPASLFFCIAGDHDDGHRFAPRRWRQARRAIVVERWLALERPAGSRSLGARAIGPMSSVIFAAPPRP
jgi:hypothetical protein